jgi:hypothetical protein
MPKYFWQNRLCTTDSFTSPRRRICLSTAASAKAPRTGTPGRSFVPSKKRSPQDFHHSLLASLRLSPSRSAFQTPRWNNKGKGYCRNQYKGMPQHPWLKREANMERWARIAKAVAAGVSWEDIAERFGYLLQLQKPSAYAGTRRRWNLTPLPLPPSLAYRLEPMAASRPAEPREAHRLPVRYHYGPRAAAETRHGQAHADAHAPALPGCPSPSAPCPASP